MQPLSLNNVSERWVSISQVSVGLFVVSFVAAWFLIAQCFTNTRKHINMPPGPWAWPIVGNLPAVLPGGQPHQALARLARRYGPVMTISFGPGLKVVLLSSANVVKDVMLKNANSVSDRRIPPLLGLAFSTKGSVIWENGRPWKAHRRIILNGFRKGLNKSSVFTSTLKKSLQHLHNTLILRSGRPFSPRADITTAIGEVICSVCFGHCLDVRNDPEISEVIEAMTKFSQGLSGISLAHIFPRLLYTPLYSKLRHDIKQLELLMKDVVHRHKIDVDDSSGNTAEHASDIVDLYLAEASRTQLGDESVIEEDFIWRAMFDLLGAGTETSSETLLWGVLYICLNPRVQDKVQSEIDANIALDDPDDVITYDQRALLPYTEATVLELLRCSCVAPLSLPRISTNDVTIMGYTIPSGTEVWVNEWAINRDDSVWRDPHDFNPERFLDDSGEVDPRMKDLIIAFGEGRRMCVGRSLAETTLFTFFSNLLRWFCFEFPASQSIPDVNGGSFGLTYSPPSFGVIISPRKLKT